MKGYEALREHAAWLDLSARGRIRATGEDRARLLHAMSTNHIQQMTSGDGCYAFFLDAQGHILADAVILAFADAFLLNTESETRESLFAHLDKYIIADDVTLEDVTAETVQLAVEGPASADILEKLGATVPAASYAHVAWNACTVVRSASAAETGFSLIAPLDSRAGLIAALEGIGVSHADAEAARVVRIETGRARYGEDITARYLPHETQALSAIHFSKGCYLGQEIVERVRARGGVHRFLVPLEIEGATPPASGTPVLSDEKTAGEITSAAYSPARGRVVALAYLRLNDIPAASELVVAGQPARRTATPAQQDRQAANPG